MSEACDESLDGWEDDGTAARAFVEVVPGLADAPTVVVTRGEFDAADDQLASALRRAVHDGGGRVVVDMTDVAFIDSSVVRALVIAQGEAAGREGWLRVAWTHPVIGRVFEVCGLAELFPQYPTVQDAS